VPHKNGGKVDRAGPPREGKNTRVIFFPDQAPRRRPTATSGGRRPTATSGGRRRLELDSRGRRSRQEPPTPISTGNCRQTRPTDGRGGQGTADSG
jgi:hypothetical protein